MSVNFTIPNVCSHGQAWYLPCAACNRPNTTPVARRDDELYRKLDRIIDLLERIARIAR